MIIDDDLPKEKQPQPFPRKLEGMAVSHLKEYKVELLVEIARIDAQIDSRGGAKAAAEKLFN